MKKRLKKNFSILVIFDGTCAFCSHFVFSLLKKDREKKLTFTPLQSCFAQNFLAGLGKKKPYPDSVMVFFSSSKEMGIRWSALQMLARALGKNRGYLAISLYIPRWLGDAIYLLVAKYRKALFRKKQPFTGYEDRILH